ncbi:MAG: hypothetical protein K2N87_13550 [Eubacterium sp.]|nr:hypothetical protein [Eubacterium sp.]
MAKTMHTIEMDFQHAKKQAEELEQIAQNLRMLTENSFQPCLLGIAANWKGENATAFCKKGAVVASGLQQSAVGLSQAADTLRQTAQNTYEAEKRSYELAEARQY